MNQAFRRQKLSREQRQALRRLDGAAERAAESDALFFKRFPHRAHRLRRARDVEIQQHRIANGDHAPLPKGIEWFTIIRRIAADRWLKIITTGPSMPDTDASENVAWFLFEIETNPGIEGLDAVIRAVAERAKS